MLNSQLQQSNQINHVGGLQLTVLELQARLDKLKQKQRQPHADNMARAVCAAARLLQSTTHLAHQQQQPQAHDMCDQTQANALAARVQADVITDELLQMLGMSWGLITAKLLPKTLLAIQHLAQSNYPHQHAVASLLQRPLPAAHITTAISSCSSSQQLAAVVTSLQTHMNHIHVVAAFCRLARLTEASRDPLTGIASAAVISASASASTAASTEAEPSEIRLNNMEPALQTQTDLDTVPALSNLLLHLLAKHLNDFQASHAAQMLWALGKLQLGLNSSIKQHLLSTCVDCIEQLRSRECAMLLHGLANLQLVPSFQQHCLLLDRTQRLLCLCNGQELSNMLWGFAGLGNGITDTWLRALYQRSEALLNSSADVELNAAASTGVSVGSQESTSALTQAIDSESNDLCSHQNSRQQRRQKQQQPPPQQQQQHRQHPQQEEIFCGFTPQDISNSLWALVQLEDVQPPQSWLSAVAAACMNSIHRFHHQELALTFWGFAKLGYKPSQQLLDAALARFQLLLPQSTPQSVTLVLYAMVKLEMVPSHACLDMLWYQLKAQSGKQWPEVLDATLNSIGISRDHATAPVGTYMPVEGRMQSTQAVERASAAGAVTHATSAEVGVTEHNWHLHCGGTEPPSSSSSVSGDGSSSSRRHRRDYACSWHVPAQSCINSSILHDTWLGSGQQQSSSYDSSAGVKYNCTASSRSADAVAEQHGHSTLVVDSANDSYGMSGSSRTVDGGMQPPLILESNASHVCTTSSLQLDWQSVHGVNTQSAPWQANAAAANSFSSTASSSSSSNDSNNSSSHSHSERLATSSNLQSRTHHALDHRHRMLASVDTTTHVTMLQWLDMVMQQSEHQLSMYNAQDLARIICSMIHYRYTPNHQWITNYLHAVCQTLPHFTPHGMAVTAWAVSRLQLPTSCLAAITSFMSVLQRCSLQHLGDFNPMQTAMLLTGVSRLGVGAVTADWLDQILDQCMEDQAAYTMRDMVAVLDAFRRLGHLPAHCLLEAALQRLTSSSVGDANRSKRETVVLLLAMLGLQHVPEPKAWGQLLCVIEAQLHSFSPRELVCVLWVLGKTRQRHRKQQRRKAVQQVVDGYSAGTSTISARSNYTGGQARQQQQPQPQQQQQQQQQEQASGDMVASSVALEVPCDIMESILTVSRDSLPALTPSESSCLCWSLGVLSAGVDSFGPALLDVAQVLYRHSLSQLHLYQPHEIATMLYSLHKLGLRPPTQWLACHISKISDSLADLNGQSLAELIKSVVGFDLEMPVTWQTAFLAAASSKHDTLTGWQARTVTYALTAMNPYTVGRQWQQFLQEQCSPAKHRNAAQARTAAGAIAYASGTNTQAVAIAGQHHRHM
eukprot:jgi/Chrzof1/14150/Cz08g27010.t1